MSRVRAGGLAPVLSATGGVLPTGSIASALGSAVHAAAQKSTEFATETLQPAIVQGATWVAANPGKSASLVAAGAGLACIAAPALVAAPALGAVGFSSGGVVAGLQSYTSLSLSLLKTISDLILIKRVL